jgi:DNA-damage-inducible protein D
MDAETTQVNGQLDKTRNVHGNGNEYWMARDLQPILGYTEWRNFKEVIDRAKSSCESIDVDPTIHFVETNKMVAIGSGAERAREDCYLSRYACYLVAMNGEPTKRQIAAAQAYFAVQTRRQEKFDELTEAQKRIELRDRVKDHNKQLNSSARAAGVLSEKFGIFHDAGYRGLYEMSLAEIKAKKNVPENETLLDHAGRVELAANDFRITQTEQKLRNENIKGQEHAIRTHQVVGQEVRDVIKKIGGTMPENLPPEPNIKKLKSSSKKKNLKE